MLTLDSDTVQMKEVQESPSIFFMLFALSLSEIIRCTTFLLCIIAERKKCCFFRNCFSSSSYIILINKFRDLSFLTLLPCIIIGEFWTMRNAMIIKNELRRIPDIGQGWTYTFLLSEFILNVYFPLCIPGYVLVYWFRIKRYVKNNLLLSSKLKVA